jgi:hypothetical protein
LISRITYGLNTIGLDVLRDEIDLALEVLLDDLLDPLHAIGELPVARHHVHGEQLAGVHHVLCVRPQRGGRTLPSIATVEQQRPRTARLELLHQRRQVGEAAHLPEAARCLLEVEVGVGVRERAAGAQAGGLEQRLADQVRPLPLHARDADVDAGLAEVDRHELRMAICHVQERHVAERRDVVEPLLGRGGVGIGVPPEAHAGGGGRAQHLEELPLRKIHASAIIDMSAGRPRRARRDMRYWLTGDFGSSSSAMMCLICFSSSMPAWPNRGMPEHAL